MCGLFGFATKHGALTPQQKNVIFRVLAVKNDSRGGDSIGICCIKNGKPFIEKRAEKGSKVVSHRKFNDLVCNRNTNIMMGHTRKASQGKLDLDNAHPHIHKDLILTHNGTVSNFEEVKDHTKEIWDCDSKHLAKLLYDKGTTEPAQGPFTVAFWQPDKGLTIQVCDRPIHIAYGNEFIIWSSEYMHLKDTLEFAGIDLNARKLDDLKEYTYTTKPNQKGEIVVMEQKLIYPLEKPSYAVSSRLAENESYGGRNTGFNGGSSYTHTTTTNQGSRGVDPYDKSDLYYRNRNSRNANVNTKNWHGSYTPNYPFGVGTKCSLDRYCLCTTCFDKQSEENCLGHGECNCKWCMVWIAKGHTCTFIEDELVLPKVSDEPIDSEVPNDDDTVTVTVISDDKAKSWLCSCTANFQCRNCEFNIQGTIDGDNPDCECDGTFCEHGDDHEMSRRSYDEICSTCEDALNRGGEAIHSDCQLNYSMDISRL